MRARRPRSNVSTCVPSSAECWYRARQKRAAAVLFRSRRLRSSHTRPRVPRALTDEGPRTRPRRCLSRDPVRGPRSTGRPARRARARRVMRPLEESEIQQVFEKLFKFVGKNLKNIVDRADQPHCFRLHKKVRRARVQPPRSPRVARFARSLRTSRRGRKPTPTRERGDRLSGGSGGARTFFSRARRSFPPVRAFRAFATAAQPDSIPRVSDSSDEEISALPNGFGR